MKPAYGLILLAAASITAPAAALREAEFTRVINDVKILPEAASPAPAKVGDKIAGRTAVATGVQSRAELRFPDRTLTRLGANSVFRMDQKTRTVEVDQGVILLQVPKQLGGAQVRTAAVTAAVSGTTLIVEYTADGYIKIIVIEGEVDVFLNDRRGVFRTLAPGDLWITRSNDKSGLPLPVKIDLKRLQKTSKLLDPTLFPPLGNQDEIDEALDEQAKLKQNGELLATAFRIEGRGRNITLTQGERRHVLGIGPQDGARQTAARRRPEPTARRPGPAPGSVSHPPDIDPPSDGEEPPPNRAINVPEATVFDERSVIRTGPGATAYNSATGAFGPLPGSLHVPTLDAPFNIYMYDDPVVFTDIDDILAREEAWFVFKGDEIYVAGNVTIDATAGPHSVILGATNDFRFTDSPPFVEAGLTTGNTWSLSPTIDSLVISSRSGSVRFDDFSLLGDAQSLLFRADGPSSDIIVNGGPSSRLSLPNGSFVARAGRDIMVAGATVEARNIALDAGRDVRLGSAARGGATIKAAGAFTAKAGQSITIANTTQLRRLTETDNLQVFLDAVNGSLDIEAGSLIDADTIGLSSRRGDVRLTGATLSAREIKARVFDTGGTLLLSNSILGRGTNPSDLIRLYGEGAGGVRFIGDTTLRGNAVDIAGTSVTIDPGGRVRLSNPSGTRVFANSHNYNNRVNGNFTGTGDSQADARPVDVNQQPFANRPGF